jgi:hypothetical protein
MLKPLAFISILCCSVAVHAEDLPRAGAWEMSTDTFITAPGAAERLATSATTNECMTPAFVAKKSYTTPTDPNDSRLRQQGYQCQTTEVALSTGSASWKTRCTLANGEELELRMRNTLAADSVVLEADALRMQAGKKIRVRSVIHGKYLGKCTPGMPIL